MPAPLSLSFETHNTQTARHELGSCSDSTSLVSLPLHFHQNTHTHRHDCCCDITPRCTSSGKHTKVNSPSDPSSVYSFDDTASSTSLPVSPPTVSVTFFSLSFVSCSKSCYYKGMFQSGPFIPSSTFPSSNLHPSLWFLPLCPALPRLCVLARPSITGQHTAYKLLAVERFCERPASSIQIRWPA